MSQQQEAKIYNEFIIQVVRVVLRCPEDQEIINNSIKNCWQDFYAEEQRKQ
jgi:hypothetical protein